MRRPKRTLIIRSATLKLKGMWSIQRLVFVSTLCWYVAVATENSLSGNHLLLRQYLPDVYRHHYARVRGHRHISTGQGRRHRPSGTYEPEPQNRIEYAQRGFVEVEDNSSSTTTVSSRDPRLSEEHEQQKGQQIFFQSPNYTVVLVQTRTTAILHCEVTNIGNNTVTWKRRRDYKILTFGMLTYSSDSRFFTRPEKNGKDWCLHIKHVQPDDAGLYECQLTSHPPASIFVDLQLVEARAEIVGGPDKIVKSGSPLVLSCVLHKSTEEPEYIFWYHGERMINYNLAGGAAVRHGRQSSELLIPNADVQHAGNYSCVPSNACPVSVNVHILHNEKPAAMQHGISKNTSNCLHGNKGLEKFHSLVYVIVAAWIVYHLRR